MQIKSGVIHASLSGVVSVLQFSIEGGYLLPYVAGCWMINSRFPFYFRSWKLKPPYTNGPSSTQVFGTMESDRVGERIQKFLDGKLLAIPFEICTNMARHSLVHKGPLAMLWKSFTTKLCVHACLLAFYFLRVIVHHQIEFMRSMDRSIIDSDSNMVT